MPDLNPATIEILATAKRLHSLVARATSCALDPDAPHLGDHDFDVITAALAETMGMCAAYLGDAGYKTDEIVELAEQISS